MQTDKVLVTSTGEGYEAALEEGAKYAAYVGLDEKQALRLRLLIEETLGMVNAITGDFRAQLWLESKPEKTSLIHLNAKTKMNFSKMHGMIDVSTDKKNAAGKGFMGKIRELVENSIYNADEASRLQTMYGGVPLTYGTMGMCDVETASNIKSCVFLWSLKRYKDSIGESMENGTSGEAAEEAWDELEKSIVASIADDVRVAVTGDTVELIIEKQMM